MGDDRLSKRDAKQHIVCRSVSSRWSGGVGGLIHGGVTSVWLVELRGKEASQKETILSLSLSFRLVLEEFRDFFFFKINKRV